MKMCLLCGTIESYDGEFEENKNSCPNCNAGEDFLTDMAKEYGEESE